MSVNKFQSVAAIITYDASPPHIILQMVLFYWNLFIYRNHSTVYICLGWRGRRLSVESQTLNREPLQHLISQWKKKTQRWSHKAGKTHTHTHTYFCEWNGKGGCNFVAHFPIWMLFSRFQMLARDAAYLRRFVNALQKHHKQRFQ